MFINVIDDLLISTAHEANATCTSLRLNDIISEHIPRSRHRLALVFGQLTSPVAILMLKY